MNSFTNSYNDRLANHRRKLQYKQILDEQIRQKKNQIKQSRFFTQGSHQFQRNSPRYQSIDIYNQSPNRPRKFQQQSVFLPVINKGQSSNYQRSYQGYPRGHQRVHSYGNQAPVYGQQTQSQTIQALAECQIIIDNLKKLVVASTSRGLGRKITPSQDFNTPSFINFNSYQKPSYAKGSIAQKQVMMFRAYEPSSQKKKPLQKLQKKKQPSDSQISKTQRFNSRDNSKSSTIIKKNAKKASNQQNQKIKEHEEDNQFQNSSEFGKESERNGEQDYNSLEDSRESQLQREKQRQEEQRRRKKQKYWLKYLAKAKLRGAQLHQKIVQFKKKLQKQDGSLQQQQEYQNEDKSQYQQSPSSLSISPSKSSKQKPINSQPQIKMKQRYLQENEKKRKK